MGRSNSIINLSAIGNNIPLYFLNGLVSSSIYLPFYFSAFSKCIKFTKPLYLENYWKPVNCYNENGEFVFSNCAFIYYSLSFLFFCGFSSNLNSVNTD
jgi:hypothetical protein